MQYPPIAELAQPMLRLAGVRVNPANNAPHRTTGVFAIVLERIADGSEVKVTSPPDATLTAIGFSPDGRRFAFTAARPTGVSLWVADAATGQAKAGDRPRDQRPVDRRRLLRRIAGLRVARRQRHLALPDHRRGPRRAAGGAGGSDRAQRAGKRRQARAGAHLRGPAHERARRGAVRVLLHQPARARRRDDRRADAGRASPASSRRRSMSPNGQFVLVSRDQAPVLAARAGGRLPVRSRSPRTAAATSCARSARRRSATACRSAASSPGRARVALGAVRAGDAGLGGGARRRQPAHEGRVPRPRAHAHARRSPASRSS